MQATESTGYSFYYLNKQDPDELRYHVTACVSYHRIAQTESVIEPSEQKSDATVKEKTSEYCHGSKT